MEGQQIFFILWLIMAVVLSTIFYVRGKAAKSIFPDIKTVKVIYRYKRASGYSTKSWITKMGGANKVLDIVVTNKELWLTTSLFFAGVAKQYDLLHKIDLDKISRVERIGKKVTIDFTSADNEPKQVVLMTKQIDEFLKAIDIRKE